MMDRKNTTTTGVRSSAIIYSLIETAKENGLDPYRYPVWLLNIAPGLSRADGRLGRIVPPLNAP